MYSVSSELYSEVAERLMEAVGPGSYFSGTLGFRFGGTECRLTASVIVYRRQLSLPEGSADKIVDLVPVWWEFHTVRAEGEVLNDFAFRKLREYL